MLSSARPLAALLGLLRPPCGRSTVDAHAAVPRSGDGGGQQRPQLRRPKPRPPPPADEVQPFEVGSQEQHPAATGQRRTDSLLQGPSLRRPQPRPASLADKAAKSARPNRQQRPAAGRPAKGGDLSSADLMRQIKGAESGQLVVQLVQRAGAQCSAFHFSAAVNRVAKLQRLRGSANNQKAFATLLAFAEQRPAVLNHVAVAQAVYAGGVLQHKLTSQQQAAWQKRLVRAFGQPDLEPRHVSNSLWGWSRMGLPLESQLAAAATAAILRLGPQMTAQQVSNTLWAYATAGWQLDSRAAAALLQHLEWVLPQSNAQDVANCLWAAAKLGLQLSSSVQAALLQHLERVLPQAEPQGVANSLWAAAKLGLQLSGSLQAALLQRLEQVLPLANAQAVANSLWAAAKLGLRLSNSLKAAFESALGRVIPAASSQHLANILLACGILGWSPGEGILAAGTAAMQHQIAAGKDDAQAVCNFLWGLVELQELGVRLPDTLPALLEAATSWAGSRWAQLSALDVCDLCYNLARLGHRTSGGWIDCAIARCLECIAAKYVEGARFASFVWACSTWGRRLQRSELEQLVPAAVDILSANWGAGGRGGGLQLADALARQEGFNVGPDHPAATAALEGRLLPLVCADILQIAASELHPKIGELCYLASCAAHLAAIGLRLPEQQLEAVCGYVRERQQQLLPHDRRGLQHAFDKWNYKPGLALLGPLDAS